MPESAGIVGLVLAGGQSRRMGGDEKSLLDLEGQPIIARVCDKLRLQVDRIAVNANGEPERLAFLGVPVIADRIAGFAGPLAGLHAGMQWIRDHDPERTHLLTVPADTPFFPDDLLARFQDCHIEEGSKNEASVRLARSNGHRHPVVGLWPVALLDELDAFLRQNDSRKVMAFVSQYRHVEVDFPLLEGSGGRQDPFFNINTPQDLESARAMWKARHEPD